MKNDFIKLAASPRLSDIGDAPFRVGITIEQMKDITPGLAVITQLIKVNM